MIVDSERNRRIIHPPLATHNDLRQPLTAGEKKVFELFDKHLSDDWEIYLQPYLNGLRPDFVLMNSKVGIAVFEVKDWNLDAMRYFVKNDEYGHPSLWAEKDGKEFCIDKHNPITKVYQYKDAIFNLYCPRLQQGNGYAAITAGVIFPFADSADVKALLEPFIPADNYPEYRPISGKREICEGNIRQIFPEEVRQNSKVMSEAHAKDLRGWLVEPDFSSTQRTPLELDDTQLKLAESRTDTGYRRIKGPAGSGKSLVLAARAARLANEGKSVLVATYNITLWHYLRDLIVRDIDSAKGMQNITFTHFHEFCKSVCYDVGWKARYDDVWLEYNKANFKWKNERNPTLKKELKKIKCDIFDEIMNVTLAILADEAVRHRDAKRYDAILSDEAQDYHPLWWNVLRKACTPNGEVLLVADATQDIYDTAKSWTDEAMKGAGFSGAWSGLKVSYRLPPKALNMARQFANNFLPENNIDLPELEQGSLDFHPCHLRWVQCDSNIASDVCFEEITSLMKRTGVNGLANADITLLASNRQSGSEVIKKISTPEWKISVIETYGEDHRRQKMAFYMGDARIKATTLHSFKGWESRLLVIYVPEVTDEKSLALIYTGLTRLKRSKLGSWLTVVSAAPRLADFGKQFDEYVSVVKS